MRVILLAFIVSALTSCYEDKRLPIRTTDVTAVRPALITISLTDTDFIKQYVEFGCTTPPTVKRSAGNLQKTGWPTKKFRDVQMSLDAQYVRVEDGRESISLWLTHNNVDYEMLFDGKGRFVHGESQADDAKLYDLENDIIVGQENHEFWRAIVEETVKLLSSKIKSACRSRSI